MKPTSPSRLHRRSPEWSAWLAALWLLASTLSTTLARAQEQPMPSDVPRTPSPSLSTERGADMDYAGSLGWETLAGVGAIAASATLSVGVGLAVANECAPDGEPYYGCSMTGAGAMVLTYLAAAPLLSSIAVTLTGSATDGRGEYLSTLGASVIGSFTGLGIATGIAAATGKGEMNPLSATLVLGALLSGPLVGALVGYRVSAQPRVRAYAMPTLDGRGATLSISGAL